MDSPLHTCICVTEPMDSPLHTCICVTKPMDSLLHTCICVTKPMDSLLHTCICVTKPMDSPLHTCICVTKPMDSPLHTCICDCCCCFRIINYFASSMFTENRARVPFDAHKHLGTRLVHVAVRPMIQVKVSLP